MQRSRFVSCFFVQYQIQLKKCIQSRNYAIKQTPILYFFIYLSRLPHTQHQPIKIKKKTNSKAN